MIYFCCDDERRRNEVSMSQSPGLNGIDFLEVRDEMSDPLELRQRTLLVHFLKTLTPGELKETNIQINGGDRIQKIKVTKVSYGTASSPPVSPPAGANILVVEVSARGDFSTYTLRLVQDANNDAPPSGFDPILSSVDFSFKVSCPSDFDCKTPGVCPSEDQIQPEINYLAKDYASFKQLMLDRMALLTPQWRERNPADLGIALVELLSYVGDYLSYQQDAVATEAYLGTARRRASVRRHARLVDYLMHDGRNARTWIHIGAGPGIDGFILEKGQGANTTKLLSRIPGESSLLIPQKELAQALTTRPLVFELLHDLLLFEAHNEMKFYTWDSRNCCLPKGATKATLRDDGPNGPSKLRAGDVLIFEERKGPLTGVTKDADPSHRHAVLLTRVFPEAQLGSVNGSPVRLAATQFTDPLNGTPVIEIEWAQADALPFPLCVSGETTVGGFADDISMALGNIALADHGKTVTDEPATGPLKLEEISTSLSPDTVPDADPALEAIVASTADRCTRAQRNVAAARYRPRLTKGPLTHATPLEDAASRAERDQHRRLNDPSLEILDAIAGPFRAKSLRSATSVIKLSTKDRQQLTLPCIWLARFTGAPDLERWTPMRELLASHANSREFAVEVETDGTSYLRFGDGLLGERPPSGTRFLATFRIGNGAAGNVGADTLAHLVSSTISGPATVTAVRNPLPATGGIEPETIEQVRQNAPSAFRIQERAVTPADYEEIAVRKELADRCGIDVQRAAATPRWTGSWHTTFLTVDRFGGNNVDDEFKQTFSGCLERFRMAGEDLEIDTPQYVSLEIEIAVCIKPGYYFSNVRQTLLDVFSDRVLPNNQRGLFHPDNLSFGQAVYGSALIAAAQAVAGVDSVMLRKFQRQHVDSTAALTSGKLALGRLEIARLSNDRNFPERGSLLVSRG
ncbi:MAG: hypothetical protein JWM21_683 [Acidobacteria bacterium]|nr:hypothetical protein [Acidobacteriota bacterium]